MIVPRQIKRLSAQELQIIWNDSKEDIIASPVLRKNCPCASCAEERGDLNHSKPLSAPPSGKKSMLAILKDTLAEQTSLVEIWGIGNYALGCRWADGHATGIYTFERLREIAQVSSESDNK
jgi:DUF971 family protein